MDKSSSVDLEAPESEYSLEHTAIYEEYRALFERRIEGFIGSIGSSAEEFFAALRRRIDADPEGSEAFFGEILISVTDFNVFMAMIRDQARARSRK